MHDLRHRDVASAKTGRAASDASLNSFGERARPATQPTGTAAESTAGWQRRERDLRCHHPHCLTRHDEAPRTVASDDRMMPQEQVARGGAGAANEDFGGGSRQDKLSMWPVIWRLRGRNAW